MASETPAAKTEYAHIVHSPGVVGGEARIAGRRIRVRDIALARDLGGLTPEEIAATVYPDLSLAQVYAALAYYEDHREEVNRSVEAEPRAVEEFLQRHPDLARDVRPDKG